MLEASVLEVLLACVGRKIQASVLEVSVLECVRS